jgi:murein DD-endopeptidase MepM/ murein hydrolase activator NlpD
MTSAWSTLALLVALLGLLPATGAATAAAAATVVAAATDEATSAATDEATAAATDDPWMRPWVWPLTPTPPVVAGFRPPASMWGPGHRGVDLLARAGQPVLAIGSGRVRFAGVVAGRGVVVVEHGDLRSTYQPLAVTVAVGARVSAGATIGTLTRVRSHCAPRACLHLGVLRGDSYLDPLFLLRTTPIVLKPLDPAQSAGRAPPESAGFAGHSSLSRAMKPRGESRPSSPALLGGTAGVVSGLLVSGAWARRVRRAGEPGGRPLGGGRS